MTTNTLMSKQGASVILATLIVAPITGGILYTTYQHHDALMKRTTCASNLRTTGSAVHAHTVMIDPAVATHQVVAEEVIGARAATCPASGQAYRFITSGEATSDPATVIAYELLAAHGGRGANVLFADGHTEFVRPERFDELMRVARKSIQAAQ